MAFEANPRVATDDDPVGDKTSWTPFYPALGLPQKHQHAWEPTLVIPVFRFAESSKNLLELPERGSAFPPKPAV